MAERAVVWYQPLAQYDDKAVAKHLKPESRAPLSDMRTRLAALAAWKVEDIDAAFHATVETLQLGMGKVAQPLRVAITGTQVSPDIAHTIYLAEIGRATSELQSLMRISYAVFRLKKKKRT